MVLNYEIFCRMIGKKRRRTLKKCRIDHELWTTPNQNKLKRRNYQPSPLKRIYINKKRPLSIPKMLDRAMQTLYKFALEPLAEITADPNSYGLQTEKMRARRNRTVFYGLRQSG